jgi:hypothetical protein
MLAIRRAFSKNLFYFPGAQFPPGGEPGRAVLDDNRRVSPSWPSAYRPTAGRIHDPMLKPAASGPQMINTLL